MNINRKRDLSVDVFLKGFTKMKEIYDNRMRRKTQNECIRELGKERFKFEFDKKFVEYRYLCGTKMKKNEYRKCQKNNAPYSYEQWEMKIKNKYIKYNKKQLEEFSRYLELGVWRKNKVKEVSSIFITAEVSGAVTIMFNLSIQTVIENSAQALSRGKNVMVALILVMPIVLGIMIYMIDDLLNKKELEKKMYVDYQKIIKKLIHEKSYNNFTNYRLHNRSEQNKMVE